MAIRLEQVDWVFLHLKLFQNGNGIGSAKRKTYSSNDHNELDF